MSHQKLIVGIDIIFNCENIELYSLSAILQNVVVDGTRLSFISNGGEKVWPKGATNTLPNNLWKCRFKPTETLEMEQDDINTIVKNILAKQQITVIKTELLFLKNGKPTYQIGKG